MTALHEMHGICTERRPGRNDPIDTVENVVRLAEYRKRRHAAQRAVPAPDAGSQYCCTRCDSGEFHLSAAGLVHCAQCGALMRNLLVGPLPEMG